MSDCALLEPALSPELREELLSRWSEPHRKYHTVEHLKYVLTSIDILRDAGLEFDVAAVRLAAWFHDAIYDIPGPDNERHSAALAAEKLIDPRVSDEVARLVEITARHLVADGDINAAVLCDADLSILGASAAEYDRYRRQVRDEYSTIPDAYFRPGRRDVLKGFLAQPSIFYTEIGVKRWEDRARSNIAREIALLE
ncbi:hypothetical protein VZC37_15560 [Gordonia sp. LSe1-13]|uniref:Metal-dependent phosphohydrolase n=1 Tax=Gordonia sesuvii TaxID=3116777 RepID=A0ABU7MF75_9ACTN|nr:hypothetical protein [Gordonia sp. LSe1-13]